MLRHSANLVFLGLFIAPLAARADFLPPNDLWQEDGLLRSSTLTEQDFNEVIDRAESILGAIVTKNYAATLKVQRLWSESTVNASANQDGEIWQVSMFGGLARRPEVTRDSFGLVLCHEIGHHLGGYPFASTWAADEGSADYFATIACPRLVWKDQIELNASFRDSVDPEPKALCDRAWKKAADQDLCYRITVAGKSMANLLAALEDTVVSWTTPDLEIVKTTYHAHPKAQCRLDTYLAGALCTKNFDQTVIPGKDLGLLSNAKEGEMEANKYSCTSKDSDAMGYRPSCWFKSLLAAPSLPRSLR